MPDPLFSIWPLRHLRFYHQTLGRVIHRKASDQRDAPLVGAVHEHPDVFGPDIKFSVTVYI